MKNRLKIFIAKVADSSKKIILDRYTKNGKIKWVSVLADTVKIAFAALKYFLS